jgi:hypothetical protein
MKSKLINMRGPTIMPFMFLVCIVACCALLAIAGRAVDAYRAKKPEPNLSLCPLCEQPVPSSR